MRLKRKLTKEQKKAIAKRKKKMNARARAAGQKEPEYYRTVQVGF